MRNELDMSIEITKEFINKILVELSYNNKPINIVFSNIKTGEIILENNNNEKYTIKII